MTAVKLDEVTDDLRRLVEAESPSSDPDALAACAAELSTLLEQRLGHPGEIGDDSRVVWEHHDDVDLPPVLILGHLDTVWPVGTLERLPFRAGNDRVTGPGTFDMKAGLVVAIHALAALRAEGRLPAVRLFVTSDEETGSVRSREAIEEHARQCGRVLVPEPCGPDGAIKTARKGVALGRVIAHGRASHAGLAPEDGVNAVVGLGAVLPQIAALGRASKQTTVVPTVFRGGSAVNTVPARAEVDLDVRFLDAREVVRLRRELAELRAPGEVDLETHLEVNRPALTGAASAPLLPALRAAAAEAGVEVGTVAVGGASDGNIAAAAGAAVLDGLGPEGDGAHADHEHVTLLGLERRIRLLTALVPHVAMVEVPAPE